MNGHHVRFALVWLVIVGVGCTSAPVRYYTLTALPDRTVPAAEATFAIDVRVHTPRQLNRSELVVRTGPTELTLLENERWASPVSDEIKEALRLELQRRLGRMSGVRPASTKLTLDLEVQRLEAELGQYALLEASWSAVFSTPDQRSTAARFVACPFQVEEKIHTGYAAVVGGYQQAIGALADAIAAAVTSRASGIDVPCQAIEPSTGDFGSKDH